VPDPCLCAACGQTEGPWWRAPFDEDGMPCSRPPREAAETAGLVAPFAFLAEGAR